MGGGNNLSSIFIATVNDTHYASLARLWGETGGVTRTRIVSTKS